MIKKILILIICILSSNTLAIPNPPTHLEFACKYVVAVINLHAKNNPPVKENIIKDLQSAQDQKKNVLYSAPKIDQIEDFRKKHPEWKLCPQELSEAIAEHYNFLAAKHFNLESLLQKKEYLQLLLQGDKLDKEKNRQLMEQASLEAIHLVLEYLENKSNKM